MDAQLEFIEEELRGVILKCAPDPVLALGVKTCGVETALDTIMPFSSLIILGVVVGIEDRFSLRLRRADLEVATKGAVTLRKLALMVSDLQDSQRTAG